MKSTRRYENRCEAVCALCLQSNEHRSIDDCHATRFGFSLFDTKTDYVYSVNQMSYSHLQLHPKLLITVALPLYDACAYHRRKHFARHSYMCRLIVFTAELFGYVLHHESSIRLATRSETGRIWNRHASDILLTSRREATDFSCKELEYQTVLVPFPYACNTCCN